MEQHAQSTAAARRGRLFLAVVIGISVALAAAACGGTSTSAGAGPASHRTTSSPSASHPRSPSPALVPAVTSGSWQPLPTMPAGYSEERTTVWTGSQLIIHALHYGPGTTITSVTLAYRPATNSWQRLARGPQPANLQTSDVAIWTGSEMLVPGLTNGAYRPATNTWRPMAREPSANDGAVVAWTGREAIVWDGVCCAAVSNRGVAYRPTTNTWLALPIAPLARRRNAIGAWTGKELIVAGGMVPPEAGSRIYRDGAAYNPVTGTWRKLPPMPGGRYGGIALWDGSEVIFLGGYASTSYLPAARGLAYSPATNRWRVLPAMHYARHGFAAVWTGRQVLVWGGLMGAAPGRVPPPHGEAYDPATNQWTALPQSPLHGRGNPAAAWTGTEMIVYGGSIPGEPQATVFTDGAAFTPAS
jgi:Kelch motif